MSFRDPITDTAAVKRIVEEAARAYNVDAGILMTTIGSHRGPVFEARRVAIVAVYMCFDNAAATAKVFGLRCADPVRKADDNCTDEQRKLVRKIAAPIIAAMRETKRAQAEAEAAAKKSELDARIESERGQRLERQRRTGKRERGAPLKLPALMQANVDILNAVVEHLGVSRKALFSDGRHRALSNARAVMVWLLRMRDLSYPDIGHATMLDHSSCVSAFQKVEAKPGLKASALDLRARLTGTRATATAPVVAKSEAEKKFAANQARWSELCAEDAKRRVTA